MDPNQKPLHSLILSVGLLFAALITAFLVFFNFQPDDHHGSWHTETTAIATAPPPAPPQPKLAQSTAPKSTAALPEPPPAASKPRPSPPPQKAFSQPLDIHQTLDEAMKLVDEEHPHAAKALLQKILKEDPENHKAIMEMGMIELIDFENPKGALPYLQKALEIDSSNQVIMSEVMGIYEELGEENHEIFEQGLNFFKRFLENNPDNSHTSLGIGQMLLGKERLAEALPFLEEASQSGTNLLAVKEYADTLLQMGMKNKAIENYIKRIELIEEQVDNGILDPEYGELKLKRAKQDLEKLENISTSNY